MDRGASARVLKKPLVLALVFTGLLGLLLRLLPPADHHPPFSTVLEDRSGYLLGARIAQDGQWRFPVSDSIPLRFEKALLCYEDRYFYYHPGFNPISLGRALLQNLRAGKIVSGGSTISMQLARLKLKNTRRSVWNKLLETAYALRLECHYSKSSMLKLYTAYAPFGGNVLGLETASWRYFGKDAAALSWAEAACLAVLPNAPAMIHPARNRNALKKKRDKLLLALKTRRLITQEIYNAAMLEPLPERSLPLPMHAAHLLEKTMLERPGIKTRSSLDIFLQQRVRAILENHHHSLENNGIDNIAALVLEVKTGNCLAYVGNVAGQNVNANGEVDVIQAPRSYGSLLKPVLYAALLHDGEILPNTLVADIPIQIGSFAPKNFKLGYDGAVPAKRALARSLNVPAVKMLQSFGVERFKSLLEKLGMTTLMYPSEHYGLSLILGGAEGSLWEMSGLYASLARVLLHYNESRQYSRDDIHPPAYVLGAPPHNQSSSGKNALLGAASIYCMMEALVEVNRPEEESAWSSYQRRSKIAWKTGTSFGFRDAWAIGTTPTHVVGVWVGNADGEGRPGLVGFETAAPVMFEIFSALPTSRWFPTPYDDLVEVVACSRSGHLAGADCEDVDTILVPGSGVHSLPCPYHRLIHLNADRQYRVNPDCEDISNLVAVKWFVLPPAQEHYFRFRNPFYKLLPPLKPGCGPEPGLQMIELISLKDVNKVFLPREIDGTLGKIVLQAAHRDAGATIYWHLDKTYLGQTHSPHQMSIQPPDGAHQLVLIDESGNRLVKSFVVFSKQNF